jgi:hypothetical protein
MHRATSFMLTRSWLSDLTMRDLNIGTHKLDIRFWREGEETAFQVSKGDPKAVERCDLAAKLEEWRTACYLASQEAGTPSSKHSKSCRFSADSHFIVKPTTPAEPCRILNRGAVECI